MKHIINLRTVVGGLAVAMLLFCGTLTVMIVGRPGSQTPGMTPISGGMTLIPAKTSTPRFLTQNPAVVTPTPPASPTALPGEIAVNLYVQITGTGGDGLRLRPEPGLGGQPVALGYETEIFQVVDGPRELDNLTWWQLVSPYDATRGGWAVADYLSVISPP